MNEKWLLDKYKVASLEQIKLTAKPKAKQTMHEHFIVATINITKQ